MTSPPFPRLLVTDQDLESVTFYLLKPGHVPSPLPYFQGLSGAEPVSQ